MLHIGLWLKALKGAVIGIGIAVLLLFACNGIALQTADPDFWVPVFTHGIRISGGLLSGILAAKFRGEGGIFPGLTSGVIYIFLLLAGALCMGGNFSFGRVMLLCGICLAASVLGSLLGKPREKSVGTRHKSMMKRIKKQAGR